MSDYPEVPLSAIVGKVARFVAEVCLVLIAGVGTGWAVWRLVELVR